MPATMEVLAVSSSQPRYHDVNGIKLYTAIVRDPLTSPRDYIELDDSGIIGNKPAVHDGPVYVCFAEHYDYWCEELGVDRASWDWCRWGENLTLRFTGKARLEDEINVGDIWRIGDTVRLQVCGARVPCMKLSWRCGQKDSWLPTLATSGRVGAYLQVLTGGRVHPGDQVSYESFSDEPLDLASITQLAFDNSLKTRDTINLLMNHKLLMRMNKWLLLRKATTMDDKAKEGRNAWKGFRNLRVARIVDECVDIKSFYLVAADDDTRPLATYIPGQFLTVRLPDGAKTTRSWTISDWDGDGDGKGNPPSYYRVSVRKTGVASTWMHEHCKADTVLAARSPAGRFTLDRTSLLRPVYVSAGIGITPVLAMMKAHETHANLENTPAVWIHVARDGAHLPFRAEIARLFKHRRARVRSDDDDDDSSSVSSSSSALFRRIIFFTNPRPGLDVLGVHYDRAGRPGPEAIKQILGQPFTWRPLGSGEMESEATFSIASVCGPVAFEEEVRGRLLALGLAPPLIRSESFAPSSSSSGSKGGGAGDVQRARVRFSKSGVEATWFRGGGGRGGREGGEGDGGNGDDGKDGKDGGDDDDDDGDDNAGKESMSLLELAESVGLTPDFGCRVGACGSCAAKLTCGSVSGAIQADGTVLTCSAMPASDEIELEI